MKHLTKRLLSLIFVIGILSTFLCTPAMARSSAYLNGYRAIMTPDSGGELVITVQVTGVGYMPELGVQKIYLYESKDGRSFTRIEIFDSADYPGMMGSGTVFYEDVITYKGTVGRYYYAKAFVYAGNSTGGDTRSCNTAIKQAKA